MNSSRLDPCPSSRSRRAAAPSGSPRASRPPFAGIPDGQPLLRGCRMIGAALLVLASSSWAQEVSPPYAFGRFGDEYRLSLETRVGYYFAVRSTPDLNEPFLPAQLAFGDPGPTFVHRAAEGETQFFLSVEAVSVFAPRDSDHDGMDDLWELARGLDPLDAADAGRPSPNVAGLTNLGEYRLRFGLSDARPQFYGREVSLFNPGAPSARFEAMTREQSVFNFSSPPFAVEGFAREISIYNGEQPPRAGYPEAYAREITVSITSGRLLPASRPSRAKSQSSGGNDPPGQGIPRDTPVNLRPRQMGGGLQVRLRQRPRRRDRILRQSPHSCARRLARVGQCGDRRDRECGGQALRTGRSQPSGAF